MFEVRVMTNRGEMVCTEYATLREAKQAYLNQMPNIMYGGICGYDNEEEREIVNELFARSEEELNIIDYAPLLDDYDDDLIEWI